MAGRLTGTTPLKHDRNYSNAEAIAIAFDISFGLIVLKLKVERNWPPYAKIVYNTICNSTTRRSIAFATFTRILFIVITFTSATTPALQASSDSYSTHSGV